MTITKMKAELEQLIHQRDISVGIDMKRLNYQINKLQNQIDHIKIKIGVKK